MRKSANAPPSLDVTSPILGTELTFVLRRADSHLEILTQDGLIRSLHWPLRGSGHFSVDLHLFRMLAHQPIVTSDEFQQIYAHAAEIGRTLYDLIFDEPAAASLQRIIRSGATPVLTLISLDETVLSLPWELVHDGTRFLVRDGLLDILRSTADGDLCQLLTEPSDHLRLLVSVAAPQGQELNYEEESYRISRVLSDRCELLISELGTLEDLVRTAAKCSPSGIHFSGHGGPGWLLFETDDNAADQVPIAHLVQRLRAEIPKGLPRFFYLASCHGNTPGLSSEGKPEVSAARLHAEGVPEVIGYFGPIAEHLSTRAEEVLYAELAAGRTTRFAIRLARHAMIDTSNLLSEELKNAIQAYPFAWSQLVFYRRGPEHPLSLPDTEAHRREVQGALERAFQDVGNRRILTTGFIGRRTELHDIRRRLRDGQRVFVLHGLGGIGKTTLAVQALSLAATPQDVCAVWCQDLSSQENMAEALVERIADFARHRCGPEVDTILLRLDRDVESRCRAVIDALIENMSNLVIYLDNLESVLIGPDDGGYASEFAEWRSPDLVRVWRLLVSYAENTHHLCLIATSRYINDLMAPRYRLPLAPLGPGALFRMTKWLPALRRLSGQTRASLVERLAGHPRAAELADGLVMHSFEHWEAERGPWTSSDPTEEWDRLVSPILPNVQQKIESDLLLDLMWDLVLTDSTRRMLFRMTLLRTNRWAWDFVRLLGEPNELIEAGEATALLLSRMSLLVAFDERVPSSGGTGFARYYSLHPSTILHVRRRFASPPDFTVSTHARLGHILWTDVMEMVNDAEQRILVASEASFHFFEGGQYADAVEAGSAAARDLLASAKWLRVVHLLSPLTSEATLAAITAFARANLFDRLAVAHRRLQEFDTALVFAEAAVVAARAAPTTNALMVSLGNLANLHLATHDSAKALLLLHEALEIARFAGDRRGEVISLSNIGSTLAQMGDSAGAIVSLEAASRLALEVEAFAAEDYTLNLGTVMAREKRYAEALQLFERAAQIAHDRSKPITEELAWQNIGQTLLHAGQDDKAASAFARSLQIAREIEDHEKEAENLEALASLARQAGDSILFLDYAEQFLRVAAERADQRGAAVMLLQVGRSFYDHKDGENAAAVFRRALNIARWTDDHLLVVVCMALYADALAMLDDEELHFKALEDTITTARQYELVDHVHNSLNNLGAVYVKRDRLAEAIACFKDAAQSAEMCGDASMTVAYLTNLAVAYSKMGDVDRAIREHDRARQLCQQLGDAQRERHCLNDICYLCQAHGRSDELRRFLRVLLDADRRSGDLMQLHQTAAMLGVACADCGDWQGAEEQLQNALQLARQLHDRGWESHYLEELATVYGAQGSIAKEIECYVQLVRVSADMIDSAKTGYAWGQLGRAYLADGQDNAALECLEKAVLTAREIGDPAALLNPLINLGGAFIRLEGYGSAIEYLEEAARLARLTQNRPAEGIAEGNLGIALISIGEREKAIHAFQRAVVAGREANNNELLDMALNNIRVLTSSSA